jgi:fructokinase
VVDAVGAGDAFTAAVAACWALGVSLETASMVANQWASWVASQSGGMPAMDEALRQKMLPQR